MNGAESLAELTRRQEGGKVWSAKKGVGTFITIDIGAETQEVINGRMVKYGTLHLWVQYCSWSLLYKEKILLSSDSPTADYERALSRVVGLTFLSISVSGNGQGLEIRFSGDMAFNLDPEVGIYEPSDEMLVIFEHGKSPLSCSVEQGAQYEEEG